MLFNCIWSVFVFIIYRLTNFQSPGSRCHSLLGTYVLTFCVCVCSWIISYFILFYFILFHFIHPILSHSISFILFYLIPFLSSFSVSFHFIHPILSHSISFILFCLIPFLSFYSISFHFFHPILSHSIPFHSSYFMMIGSALGLLLVFRTNTAYNRFWEGRRIWEKILTSLRDLGRMTVLYGDVIESVRVERILHLLCAYPLGIILLNLKYFVILYCIMSERIVLYFIFL